MRIWNLEPSDYSSEAQNIYKKLGEYCEGELTRQELLTEIPSIEVLITRLKHNIDKELMSSGHRLKVIVTPTTGVDHIDMDSAKQLGITVLSLRGEYEFLSSIRATAEHTWALLLSLARNIPQAFNSVCEGQWDRDRFKGIELAGKRLGILGLGRVGKQVASFGQAFKMSVGYFDIEDFNHPSLVRYNTMKELFQNCDVLSIHVPLNADTSGMVGSEEFDWLPKGSLLINTSRGAIIDDPALLEHLKSGHLAGAALDVLSEERTNTDTSNILIDYARTNENLLITPHLGGATWQSMHATERFMAEKLMSFISTSNFNKGILLSEISVSL